jgi:hypothetical protein
MRQVPFIDYDIHNPTLFPDFRTSIEIYSVEFVEQLWEVTLAWKSIFGEFTMFRDMNIKEILELEPLFEE